ncbi:MAG: CPBP family intramembrane metalloprotease, partial [Ruminococcus sp.]|nr:CPBP family intramembrane metalloprotease [Ruminococcus sp.]
HGLKMWEGSAKEYLFFIPLLIVMTGNLWFGVQPQYEGMGQVLAVVSMILVGYIEEMIFRGFLFGAILKRNKPSVTIIISAATFGVGHIVNLLTGQATLDTVVQIVFALAMGMLFTVTYYKSGSLVMCIIVHSLTDVFSKFACHSNGDEMTNLMIQVGVTVVIAVFYCLYLKSKPAAVGKEVN